VGASRARDPEPFPSSPPRWENVYDGVCKRNCLKKCSHSSASSTGWTCPGGQRRGRLIFSGENVWKLSDIPSVRELIDRLVAEAESVYAPVPA
jgi:hypothetical protein